MNIRPRSYLVISTAIISNFDHMAKIKIEKKSSLNIDTHKLIINKINIVVRRSKCNVTMHLNFISKWYANISSGSPHTPKSDFFRLTAKK